MCRHPTSTSITTIPVMAPPKTLRIVTLRHISCASSQWQVLEASKSMTHSSRKTVYNVSSNSNTSAQSTQHSSTPQWKEPNSRKEASSIRSGLRTLIKSSWVIVLGVRITTATPQSVTTSQKPNKWTVASTITINQPKILTNIKSETVIRARWLRWSLRIDSPKWWPKSTKNTTLENEQ